MSLLLMIPLMTRNWFKISAEKTCPAYMRYKNIIIIDACMSHVLLLCIMIRLENREKRRICVTLHAKLAVDGLKLDNHNVQSVH